MSENSREDVVFLSSVPDVKTLRGKGIPRSYLKRSYFVSVISSFHLLLRFGLLVFAPYYKCPRRTP